MLVNLLFCSLSTIAASGWNVANVLQDAASAKKETLIKNIQLNAASASTQKETLITKIHIGMFGLGESILGEPFYDQVKQAVYGIEMASNSSNIHFHLVVSGKMADAAEILKVSGMPKNLQVHALDEALENKQRFRDDAHQKAMLEIFNSPGINKFKNPAEGESEREYGNRMVRLLTLKYFEPRGADFDSRRW